MTTTLPQKLLAVQKKIGAVTKSSTNPHFRSKYADLNEVLDVAKEALNSEGIFVVQGTNFDNSGAATVRYVETSLIDADSGQSISGRVAFSGSEDNMQKIGAAITYARRFGLVSLLSLESEDDDGESAVGRGKSNQAPKPSAPVASTAQAPDRKTVNAQIKATGKVLIAKKAITADDAGKMLAAYGATSTEELTDDQANQLLSKLKEKL